MGIGGRPLAEVANSRGEITMENSEPTPVKLEDRVIVRAVRKQ
jgi:hypothetical protein